MSLASSGLEEKDNILEGFLENLSRTHVHAVDRKGGTRVSTLEGRPEASQQWQQEQEMRLQKLL